MNRNLNSIDFDLFNDSFTMNKSLHLHTSSEFFLFFLVQISECITKFERINDQHIRITMFAFVVIETVYFLFFLQKFFFSLIDLFAFAIITLPDKRTEKRMRD